MKAAEIKRVTEYPWGNIMTVIEDNKTRTLITVRVDDLCIVLLALNVVLFLLGFLLGGVTPHPHP